MARDPEVSPFLKRFQLCAWHVPGSGRSSAERLEHLRRTLDEEPYAPRSLVARLQAYVPPASSEDSPLPSTRRRSESSPSLQDALLAHLRGVLDVENAAR